MAGKIFKKLLETEKEEEKKHYQNSKHIAIPSWFYTNIGSK